MERSGVKLSQFVQGRDNNFNLIRFVAAFAVLFSHSFALVAGSGDAEPLRFSLGMTFGTMAVDVFFITSGFLVTASLLTRQSTIEFVAARVLRIYPAILVMSVITVFVVGAYFTSQSLSSYFFAKETFRYLFKNVTLVFDVAYTLPGVFDFLPIKRAVNGSLWTLPFELGMYAALLLIWVVLGRVALLRVTVFRQLIFVIACIAFVLFYADHFYFHTKMEIFRLVFVFFIGAAFYVLKDKVLLNGKVALAAMLVLVCSALHKDAFFAVYYLTLAYLLFWLAYIPKGPIRQFNRIGDYSYGVYIYAFLVQQALMAFMPKLSVIGLFVCSALITFGCAYLSWNLVEKRALALKGHCVEITRKAWISMRAA